MAQRILGSVVLSLILATIGCADGSSFRAVGGSGETTTSTKDIPPPQNSPEKIAPLAFKDEHTFTKLPSYTVPDKVRERLAKVRPDLVTPKNDSFQVFNQHLKVSVKNKTFTFTGTLRIAGKQDEPLEMSCSFDPADVPWSCADMFPVDQKKAEEKRLQATVNCQDTYKCEDLGVELFVVINGKTRSQLFQSEPFRIRRAESGDHDEDSEESYTPPKEVTKSAYTPPKTSSEYRPPVLEKNGTGESYKPPTGLQYTPPILKQPTPELAPPNSPPDQPKVLEKPTPEATPPSSLQFLPEEQMEYEEEEISDEELNELMTDANTAAEVTTPMYMPTPKAEDKRAIVGIQTLRPTAGNQAPNQARGKHSRGSLRAAEELPKSGAGYKSTSKSIFGTNLMVEMITKVSAAARGSYPVIVRDISKPAGGRIGGHASHQNGLDVDIGFPSTKPTDHFFAACETSRVRIKGRNATVCRPGRVSGRDLDEAAFWKYLKTFTCTNAKGMDDGKVVIAIFLDKEIKKHMCQYVRGLGEDMRKGSCAYKTLRALKHEGNHHHHIHVRLHCPNKNGGCQESTVSLADGTGC